jgi:hypothetical protein
MPWGKHKNESLDNIKGSYLFWVLEECDSADESLKADIREELGSRLPQRPRPTPVVQPGVDRAKVLEWCRRAAIACHPDHGGSVKAMKLVNELRGMIL